MVRGRHRATHATQVRERLQSGEPRVVEEQKETIVIWDAMSVICFAECHNTFYLKLLGFRKQLVSVRSHTATCKGRIPPGIIDNRTLGHLNISSIYNILYQG